MTSVCWHLPLLRCWSAPASFRWVYKR